MTENGSVRRAVPIVIKLTLLGLLVGTLTGWAGAVRQILENQYMDRGYGHLAARVLAAQVRGTAWAFVVGAAAFIMVTILVWPLARWVLGSRERGLRGAALGVVVAVFLARTALWLNSEHLPGMFDLVSLAADAGLVLAALTVWGGLLFVANRIPSWRPAGRLRWTTGWVPGGGAIVLVLVAQAVPLVVPPKLDAPGPDVIILLVDTLRPDRLGTYGYERNTSPNIDALARESWTYNQAMTTASWTKPSVASLFTALYPHQHGIGSGSWSRTGDGGEVRVDALEPGLVTLAEVLADGGYRTAAVGHNHHLTEQLGFSQGFDTYIWGLKDDVTFTSAPEIHRRFLGWMDQQHGRLFAYLHYIDVHWPYLPPAPFAGHLSGPRPALDYNGHDFIDDAQKAAREGTLSLSDEVVAHMSDSYDELIQFVDAEIGKLLEDLKARDRYDSSLIVLTGDHGEEFLEHGQVAHGTSLYDVLVQVPLIVKFPCPGPQCGPKRIDSQVELLDLYRTILAAAGLTAPEEARGRDLATIGTEDVPAFAERGDRVAIRTSGYKYILSLDNRSHELYDLRADPGEHNDLTREQPELSASLREDLLEWVAETTVLATGGGRGVVVDEKTLEQLRALGYVE